MCQRGRCLTVASASGTCSFYEIDFLSTRYLRVNNAGVGQGDKLDGPADLCYAMMCALQQFSYFLCYAASVASIDNAAMDSLLAEPVPKVCYTPRSYRG
jgi:hypothetical protein